MASVEARQRNALNEFLNQHQSRAYQMTYAMTSNRDDALELVQDAMLKLVQHYADKTAEDWQLLFYRILHNRIRDHHRRSPLRSLFRHWFSETTDDDEAPQFADPQQRSPEQEVQQQDNLNHLIEAIRSLPLRQQQTFLLRAWQGFSVSETAFALSISEGSVKTHYSRAQNQLRNIIGDQS